MRRRRPGRDDGGNAIVEFVWLGTLLMVPLVYVVLGVFDVQRTSFGVTEAARQAGRSWVVSGCDAAQYRRVAALALQDQGVTQFEAPVPGDCPQPGEQVVVRVRGFAPLPGIGPLLPDERGGVWVSASFVAVRDRFVPDTRP